MRLKKFITKTILFFCVQLLSANLFAQVNDSLQVDSLITTDTLQVKLDTSFFDQGAFLTNAKSVYTQLQRVTKNDFEITHTVRNSAWMFLWIVVALLLFVLLRNIFKRDLNEMLQSLMNKQLSTQINRTKGSMLSYFSLMLIMIFVVNVSIMTMYSLQYFYPKKNHYTIQILVLLIFLFTFFIVLKVLVTNTLGYLFDEQETTNAYVNDLLLIVKMLGITIFPQVLMMYVADKNLHLIFVILFFSIVVIYALLFLWRGLSTSILMMYKSVYHFLLYVCLAETLYVFLLIKLLTKIAS